MKTKMINAVLSAMLIAMTGIGGMTVSAANITEATEAAEKAETTAATEESSDAEETTETTTASDDMEKFREVMSDLAEAGTTDVEPDYYSDPYYDTDGNATLIKSEQIIYNTEEMQFIAVTTKDGHVFYVLINYSAKNGEDNVYFLNRVDDYDLYALLYAGKEDEDGNPEITPEQALRVAEKANGRVQSGNDEPIESEAVTEDGEDAAETEVQVKPAPMNMGSIYLIFGAIALIGAGAAVFFLTKKKSVSKPAAMAMPEEDEDETEIVETEDEDDMNFYDHEEDEDE